MATTGTIIGALCHILFIWIFNYQLEWDFYGICLATALHFMVRFSVNLYFNFFGGYFETFDDVKLFSKQSTTDLKD